MRDLYLEEENACLVPRRGRRLVLNLEKEEEGASCPGKGGRHVLNLEKEEGRSCT